MRETSQEVVVPRHPRQQRMEIEDLFERQEITLKQRDQQIAALDAQVEAAGGVSSYARKAQEARFEYRRKYGVWPED